MDLDAIRRGLLNKIHQTAQSFKANTLDKTDLDERIVSGIQNTTQRFAKPSQQRVTSQNFKPVFQTRLQNVKPVNYANVAKTTLSTIGSQPLVRSPLIGLETPQSIPRVRDLNPFTQTAEQAPILGPIRKFFREGAEQSVQNYTGKPFESKYPLGSPQRYAQLTQAYMGTPEGAFDVGLSIGGGSNAIQKNLRKYTTYVKNNFDKETLNKIGYFSELVETGKDKGELGSIGQEIQAIANDVFGKQANGWTNRKIKNAFDLVLGKVAARENPFGLGLAVNELQRKKQPVSNAGLSDMGKLEPLANEARKYNSAEEFVNATKSKQLFRDLKFNAIKSGPKANLKFGDIDKIGEKYTLPDEKAIKIAREQILALRDQIKQRGNYKGLDQELRDFYKQATGGEIGSRVGGISGTPRNKKPLSMTGANPVPVTNLRVAQPSSPNAGLYDINGKTYKQGEEVGFAGILSPEGEARKGKLVRKINDYLVEVDYGDHVEQNHVKNIYKLNENNPRVTQPSLESKPVYANISSEGTKMKSGKIKVRNFPTQTEVKNRAELNAGNPDLYTQRKAKLLDNADEDTVNLVREAIDSGDIQGARALHQELSNEFRMPQFENLVREIDDARNQALSGAKQVVGEAKKDEYQEIMGRMKQLLKQKGESPNGEGTLYREHIPAKDLGQSSDEVADALGMTESEFMQELAKGIQMKGKAQAIKINTKQSREMAKLDKNISERKEFNTLYNPVKRNGQLVGVSAEMSPQAQSMLKLRTQESMKKEANKAFNEWQKQVFKDSGGSRTSTGAVNDLERAMRKATRSSAVRDFKKLKDISSPAGKFKDIFRNFKTVYGDKYNEVKKQILDPLFIKGKNDLLDDQEQWIKKIDSFEKEYGIRKGSPESADVQKYGEGLVKKGDLIKKYGNKKADQIVKADEWFRSNYDQLLTEVNKVRKQIYPNNPDKIIPKRQDYYRHFSELSQGIDGLLNTLGRTVDVSPELGGISYRTKPKSKWLSFAQRRLGEKTEYDAVGGFIDYVKAQTYAKHIDPHINTFRQLSEELGEEGIENNRGLNNFSLFLQRFADDLSGKTNDADRFVQESMGRKPMAVLNWINSRVKANTILGNASSTLAQAFNLPNGIAEAGPKHAVKGINRALASMYKKNRPMDQSTFLRERYFRGFDKFERGMINDGRKLAAWMITALDEASSKAIWNMQYEKALTNNISDPIAYADDVTRRMVGGRGIGEMPLIQRSKVFQLVAPFQLEVTNAWHVIGDMIGERAFGKLMTLALTSYVMNRAVERVRGSDVSFDPINAVVDGVQAFNEEENKGVGVMRFGGRVGGEVLSNTPIVGQVVGSIYPEYGNKEWGLPAREQFFGEGDPTRYGSGLLATKGLQDPLFKLIPPYGGQQLKRTLEGIGTSMRGYSETPSGNVRFPIENNLLRDAQRAVFGQYSTPEARQYFDEDRRPLGENQTQDFLASNDKNAYYDQIISNRESDNLKEDAEARLKGEDTDEGFFSGLFGQAEASDRLTDLSAVYELDTLGDEPKTTLAKEKWEDKRWDKALDIYNNSKEIDGVTEEEKQQLIEQMGVSYEDVAYYDLAKQENRIKSIVVREQLDEILSTSSNREDMLQTLAEMRKQIRGKEVLAPGVIDDLVDEGYISYAEGKELKKISFDKDGNPKVKVSGRGSGAKLKKVKFVTPKFVAGNIGSAKKSDLSRMRLPKLESISPNFSTPNLQVPNIRVGNPSQPVFNVRFDL